MSNAELNKINGQEDIDHLLFVSVGPIIVVAFREAPKTHLESRFPIEHCCKTVDLRSRSSAEGGAPTNGGQS